jgi:hypothetical protein
MLILFLTFVTLLVVHVAGLLILPTWLILVPLVPIFIVFGFVAFVWIGTALVVLAVLISEGISNRFINKRY